MIYLKKYEAFQDNEFLVPLGEHVRDVIMEIMGYKSSSNGSTHKMDGLCTRWHCSFKDKTEKDDPISSRENVFFELQFAEDHMRNIIENKIEFNLKCLDLEPREFCLNFAIYLETFGVHMEIKIGDTFGDTFRSVIPIEDINFINKISAKGFQVAMKAHRFDL